MNLCQTKNSSWNGKIKTIQHLEETGKQDMKKFTQAKFDTSFSRFGGIISSKKQQATGFLELNILMIIGGLLTLKVIYFGQVV